MPPTSIKLEALQQPQKSDDELWLDFLLESIMGFPPNSDVKLALTDAGVRSIVDIFTLEDDLISHLTYNDGTERVSLKLLDISKLRKIGPFHELLCDRENVYALTDYQWTTVEPQDWREYCVNPKSFGGSPKPPATTRAAATTLRDTFAKSRSRKTQRLTHPSRKPGFGTHGIESFTARRIYTISRMCWTTVTYLQRWRKTSYSSFRSVLCTQFS